MSYQERLSIIPRRLIVCLSLLIRGSSLFSRLLYGSLGRVTKRSPRHRGLLLWNKHLIACINYCNSFWEWMFWFNLLLMARGLWWRLLCVSWTLETRPSWRNSRTFYLTWTITNISNGWKTVSNHLIMIRFTQRRFPNLSTSVKSKPPTSSSTPGLSRSKRS